MTLDELKQLLASCCPDIFEVAAPATAQRYIVYTHYTESSIRGDDTVCLAVEKVQIDICAKNLCDHLASAVKDALTAAGWHYSEVASGYDDEFAVCRTILQTWVL